MPRITAERKSIKPSYRWQTLLFLPNVRYLLENEKFRLYYTSASTETQTLTVVVEDNFGKSYEMEFSFNDTDEEEFARSANKLGSV